MKKLLAGLLIISSVLVNSAVHGDTVTRSVPLTSEITRIYLYGNRQLNLTQGEEEFVRLTAPEELLAQVEARIRGRSLYLGKEFNVWQNGNPGSRLQDASIRFDVQLKRIDAVRVLGSGRVKLNDLEADRLRIYMWGSGKVEAGTINSNDMRLKITGDCDFEGAGINSRRTDIEVSGSAKINIGRVESDEVDIEITGSGDMKLVSIEAGNLETEISGSGDLDLAGHVGYQDLELSGSADYRASNLITEESYINIFGSGDVEISVQRRLTAQLSRGADLVYYSGPDLEVDISGRGKSRNAGNSRRNE